MGKLHELIPVTRGLECVAIKVLGETKNTFVKKEHHFTGFERTLLMLNEEDSGLNGIDQQRELVETVPSKLEYVFGHINSWLDAILQRDATNCVAKADIVINGGVLAKDVPATFLLDAEKKLKLIRELFVTIPKLTSGVRWELNQELGTGIYSMVVPEVTDKTKKVLRFVELSPATKEHKAQVHSWNEDMVVGKYTKATWSGAFSTAEISIILGRLDVLDRAVRSARARANNVDVVQVAIGAKFSNFLMTGNI